MKSPDAEDAGTEERLAEVARSFVPRIVELAPRMRSARKLDDDLVEDMDKAGLLSMLVSKRWGGAGLGPREATEVIEIIGAADCSTAWVASFYMLHNWLFCKFPMETQQELFKGRNSVRAPAVFGPPGTAERVDGGYRINGRWPYGSGAWHASHALVPAIIEGAMHWCIVAREDVEYIDDWHMEAMSATGSITIAAKDVFVADGWHMDVNDLTRAADHAGSFHEEESFRLPFAVMSTISASLVLGALDRAVRLARDKLPKSFPLGVPRIERPAARIRWANAYQQARVLRLVRDAAADEAIRQALAGEPATLESEAARSLHGLYLIDGAKDTLRLLVDGLGSSTYRTDDPIYRIAQDVAVLATHALGGDYDIVMDRHARWLLGLGVQPGDPPTRLT